MNSKSDKQDAKIASLEKEIRTGGQDIREKQQDVRDVQQQKRADELDKQTDDAVKTATVLVVEAKKPEPEAEPGGAP